MRETFNLSIGRTLVNSTNVWTYMWPIYLCSNVFKLEYLKCIMWIEFHLFFYFICIPQAEKIVFLSIHKVRKISNLYLWIFYQKRINLHYANIKYIWVYILYLRFFNSSMLLSKQFTVFVCGVFILLGSAILVAKSSYTGKIRNS